MLVGSDGLDKTGKTNFFLTAPGPIAGINLDIGLEGVTRKFSKDKRIWMVNYNIPPIDTKREEYAAHYFKIKTAYEKALNHKDVRTVVIDTGTDFWELIRLAEFGVVNPKTSAGSLSYTSANNIYRGLMRMAYDSDKNLIVTHKLGKNWIKTKTAQGADTSTWDGTYERDGFRESSYLVQVNIRHFYRDGQFGIQIINCRHNMEIAGMELPQDECTFAHLGVNVFEGSTLSDWK